MKLLNKLQAYIALYRIDKPVGSMLLLWSSLWGLWLAGNGTPPAEICFIVLLGTFTMRSAGCAVNDYADRNFDGNVKRTKNRPLATGTLSEKEALSAIIFMLFVSFLLLLCLNWQSWLMAIYCLFIAIIYPFCKRFFPLPQFVLGLAFSAPVLIAHTAILGHLTWAGFFIYMAGTFWALVYDTFYALVDRDDDIPMKLHSSAIFCLGWEKRFLALMAAITLFFMFLAGICAGLGFWFYLGLISAALIFSWEIYYARNLEREKCFAMFFHNNWVGAAIFTGVVLDYLP